MRERIPKIRFTKLALALLVLVLSLASSTHVGPSKAEAGPADDTIRLGIITAETGAASGWGTFTLRGAMLAVQQINNAGGLLGKKIELIRGDEQCIPAEGVSAGQRLIHRDNAHMLMAALCSSSTKALMPIIEEAKIPNVCAASSDPEISYMGGVGGFKWFFHNYPTDEIRALVVLEYAVNKKGFSKFSILAVDNDFGRSIVSLHNKYLKRFPNIKFVSTDYYGLKETDFRSVLSKIKAAGAEVILLYATAGDTVQIVGRQMREVGLAGKVRIMGLFDIMNPGNLKALGPLLEGAVEASLWVPQLDHPRNRQFIESYKKMFGEEVPNFLAYSYWETVHLIAQAIKTANSLKNEDIYNALKTIKYEGVMGTIRFDDHNQANLPMVLLEVEKGEVKIIGSFYSEPDYPTKKK